MSNSSQSGNENTNDESSHTAKVEPVQRISKVWFIPIVALFIGSWMVYQTWANQGPLITIYFETAEGIEIDITKVKLRDIPIGKVVDLNLNERLDGIQITARLDKHTDELLRIDTEFWVVKPRIGNGGVSGLSTLLSGAYIEISPGVDEETKLDFVGLESPPVTPLGTPGLHITLDSDGQSGLNIGDPIVFRGIPVGRVEYVHFNVEERRVYYNAFIERPYDKLVTTNTRFWKINGIEIDLSADGLQVHTGTFETFMGGGVAFDVPDNLPKGEVVSKRAYYTIYEDKKEVLYNQFKHAQEFVLLFGQSIRGLKPGAPVEYKGVRIGTVARTDIDYQEMGNLLEKNTRIPVLIRIEPARLGMEDLPEQKEQVESLVNEMITSGLHGFISSGNLLTGSKFIEIQYVSNTRTSKQFFEGYRVIPTATSEIDNLLEKLDSIFATIDKLPLDTLVGNATTALSEMKIAMVDFSAASSQVDQLLADSAGKQLIANVNETLLSIETLANDFSKGSQTHIDIQNMLRSLESMLKELSPVLSQLNHQPNSLIFGGKQEQDILPLGVN
ncbi:MAG: intermembrane transport protein PqiB [Kangiellaceae bacterium]|nr:intermembrane transport protein PqiB [Kangiellaceae bacterium]